MKKTHVSLAAQTKTGDTIVSSASASARAAGEMQAMTKLHTELDGQEYEEHRDAGKYSMVMRLL